MICVSTQLIEAGVDISFETVIRSLAGLDSIVQAAGRCNRNCENKSGNVFIVKIADENVSRIIDIKMSQEAMNTVLYTYHSHPELLDNDLLSKKAMDLYFTHYFMNRKSEMNYNIPALDTTIVELLSNNPIGSKNLKKKLLLKQAFKTAGEEFQVIADIAKRDVVVEWNKESKELIADMNSDISIEQQIGILKKLQVYSVSISVFEEKNLLSQSALFTLKNAGVVVLKEIFYDDQIGVSVNPTAMDPYFH
jgi:CRISPR-associated endonuclease/helicase Cas3